MALKIRLAEDLNRALKSRAELKVNTLRFLLAAIHNQEIAKRTANNISELTDEEVIGVLNREAKKRKEAAEIYRNGKRGDLAEKEMSELAVIQTYLPARLNEEEIKQIVAAAVERVDAREEKDFGRVMGEAMKLLKGRADGAFVSQAIRAALVERNQRDS